MLDLLKEYIKSNKLFATDNRILLTVSGGIDSMVMLHLFKQLEVKFAVAHCNFQLRGNESDEDAAFVKTSVEILGVPHFTIRFDTTLYAEENKLSIQMAARELRYTWFENIRKLHHYDYISTAHNSDDSIETFFINLSRGCGLEGLTGIKPKMGQIIRPLLFVSRKEIEAYARKKGVLYREDSSNISDKYLRNFIRHRVIPLLEESNPTFRKSAQTTIANLNSSNGVYDHAIQQIIPCVTKHENNTLFIDINQLKTFPEITTLLWEILKSYQFNRDICHEITNALDGQPGKIFLSPTHRLVKDRNSLIIAPLDEIEHHIFYLEYEKIQDKLPIPLSFEVLDCHSDLIIDKSPAVAMLDFNLLEWPLLLRLWKQGDYFSPLGMTGFKKASDFFVDLKLSIPEKENTWVIESAGRIAWIVGKRIDNRFKVTQNTAKVLKVKLLR